MRVEAWLGRAARATPEHTAIQTPHERLSYAQLWRAAGAGARELAERGADSGARVAIALVPGADFAVALHASMLAGVVAVPIDPRLTTAERELLCAGAAVRVEEPLARPKGESSAPAPGVASPRPLGAQGSGCSPELSSAAHDLDAVCAVIHTSGTTSAPRPVELTYGNFLWSALGSGVALGVDPAERWLCALPLSHVGGLSILVRSAIYRTTAVVHERFETERVLRALREEQVTLVSLVSTTLTRLLDAGLRDPPALRCALTGGGPVPASLLERARAAGVPVCETYGLTECCSQAATVPLAAGAERDGRGHSRSAQAASDASPAVAHARAAVPLFCTRVEISGVPPDRPGEPPVGEILLSGPTVARGSLAADGCLHTGDLGWLDADGALRVVGRVADTIISGGENVAPSEVEAVLEAHPAVLEAAVVGREDPEWGEAVIAIVVVAPGTEIEERELRAHCATALAPFKIPKRVERRAAPLPRTRSGKLLRRDLQGEAKVGDR